MRLGNVFAARLITRSIYRRENSRRYPWRVLFIQKKDYSTHSDVEYLTSIHKELEGTLSAKDATNREELDVMAKEKYEL